MTLIYCVENEFNLTSEVQNIENRVFQNALFANAPCFQTAVFQTGITVPSGQCLVNLSHRPFIELTPLNEIIFFF